MFHWLIVAASLPIVVFTTGETRRRWEDQREGDLLMTGPGLGVSNPAIPNTQTKDFEANPPQKGWTIGWGDLAVHISQLGGIGKAG